MWLSKQQKQPARSGEGRTGTVILGGDSLTVRLDREVSAPELYGPAGYRWRPAAGDRVLVIKGEGERPCVVGVREGTTPSRVAVEAKEVALLGGVTINGTPLEDYVKALAAQVLEGSG